MANTNTNTTNRARARRRAAAPEATAPEATAGATAPEATDPVAALAAASSEGAAALAATIAELTRTLAPSTMRSMAGDLRVAALVTPHAEDDGVVAAWEAFRSGRPMSDPMAPVLRGLVTLAHAVADVIEGAPDRAAAAAAWEELAAAIASDELSSEDIDATTVARIVGHAVRRRRGGSGCGGRGAGRTLERLAEIHTGPWHYRGAVATLVQDEEGAWALEVDGQQFATPTAAARAQHPDPEATSINGWGAWVRDGEGAAAERTMAAVYDAAATS